MEIYRQWENAIHFLETRKLRLKYIYIYKIK